MTIINNHELQVSHKVLTLLEKASSTAERIIDQFPGVFLIVNERFDILRGNFDADQIFDCQHDQLLRTNLKDLFPQGVWNLFSQQFSFLSENPDTKTVKFEANFSNNHNILAEKPFFWQISKLEMGTSVEGQLYSLKGEDISQIRESESKLVNIFASIPLGILLVDASGYIEDSYSNYLEYLLSNKDLEGKNFREIIFEPIENDLTHDELKGLDELSNCLNKQEEHFHKVRELFPTRIFYYRENNVIEGKHLKLSYQPVCYEGIVKRLLIILEDRTKIIITEREKQEVSLLQEQSRAIYESAIRDPLTGLYTRLYMEEKVQKMVENHDDYAMRNLSLVFFDLDHFKQINDNYGHDIGDEVLRQVAAVITYETRETDLAVRFGGEEFLVFIPTDEKGASIFAERVRKSVGEMQIDTDSGPIKLTMSGGISQHKQGESLQDFIKHADNALYSAKRSGRDRIVLISQLNS